MADWSSDLGAALESGDPRYMKAMLERVPPEVLEMALPALLHLARDSEAAGRFDEALSYLEHLVQAAPGDVALRAQRARLLARLDRYAEALADAERLSQLAPDDAAGYRLQAQCALALGEREQELAALRRLLQCEPADEAARLRVADLEGALAREAMLRQAIDPAAKQEATGSDAPSRARSGFDPALLRDPSLPSGADAFRVDGIRQHLLRYSGQLSPRNAIARLEDPAWLEAWDSALAGMTGLRALFAGSELGVFALRALGHGAAHALCVEAFALDARIASGMIQKHFLGPWRALHGDAIASWSEEERGSSFEQFASAIDIVTRDAASAQHPFDCLVFPGIDHTLLGTGIVQAIRKHASARQTPPRVLPARATVYAMGIEWNYPGSGLNLEAMNRLRWSIYPQALEVDSRFWSARTQEVCVARIDFENFEETEYEISLPVTDGGRVDAIMFWFELDLGAARVSNAPGSELRCIKPAVQYCDPIAVQAGQGLQVRLRVEESRLYFEAQPPATLVRTDCLPGWYVPMLGDDCRNGAYRAALERALAGRPEALVLDIGAGCGLLSMMAVQAGAGQVVGCESDAGILEAAREIVAANGFDGSIALVGKDCRNMQAPGDLPRKADLALIELFDCSLIGEGILHFLAHAREHLLADDASYLPAAARIRAMLVEYRIDRVWDIDASLLNPFRATPGFVNVDASKLDYRPLTEPFDVFSFDFATAGPAPQEQLLRVPAIASGVAGAVLFWFDLGLGEQHWISNAPGAGQAPHWKQGLQFLPEVQVAAGIELPLLASHNGSALQWRWQADAIPGDAVSRVPRCDPRVLAANAELEQQTRSLLQHCAQHPGEHAKVVEIAQRLAADPGRHGIDPVIAQRFASMLSGA